VIFTYISIDVSMNAQHASRQLCCKLLPTLMVCHWVCKPAYLMPVPSQDKLGGLCEEGHPA